MNKMTILFIAVLFFVNAQAQNVGIGTNTPADKLTVYTGGESYGFTQTEGNVTVGSYIGSDPYNLLLGGWFGTKSNHPLYFFTNDNVAQLTLLQNNNFGIGTSSPTNTLSVNGKADFSGNVGIGTTTPGSQFHIADVLGTQDNPSANMVLSRVWIDPTNTRASSIFHYYSTATANDALAFGVAGGGGTNEAPNSLSQIKMLIQASGNVGIGTTAPAASAKLDISSTTAGVLLPRMTTAQKNAIINPVEGLEVYDLTLHQKSYFNGSGWVILTPPSQTAVFLPTIVIGTQQWMSKNLDVAFYRNGDPIPQVKDPAAWAALTTGAWCYYNNDSSLGNKYGKLYNWFAVNDPRGLAPQGWHIPSDPEWTALGTTLGGESVAGGKMKEAGTLNWGSPNTDGNNNSGWEGLPGGNRSSGTFLAVSFIGSWWSATENSAPNAFYRTLSNTAGDLLKNNLAKKYGFSVRCIRD